MVDERELFVLISEFIKIYQKDQSYDIVIWGTGEVAIEVYKTLTALSIPIQYFGDNSEDMKGKIFFSRRVLTAGEAAGLKNPLVVIGSFAVRPIWEQLQKHGIKEIFVIIDTFKYSYKEIQEEKLLYCMDEEKYDIEEDILLEAYGNIGDIILKGGIFNYFLSKFGKKHVYILVETESIASFARLFTDHVFVGNKKQIKTDINYRRELLSHLCQKGFQTSYILSDIRLHFTRRYLNEYNFNVKDIRYHMDLPENQYLPEMDANMIRFYFSLSSDYNMGAKDCLKAYLDRLPVVANLPYHYVAVNMGATKKIRHYDVKKMSVVINYLIQLGFRIVMLGYGDYDEEYYKELVCLLSDRSKIINFISTHTLLESFYVILHSDFFVGTDSGMWNVSYILGKKSVVIYGGGEDGNFKHIDSNVHYAMVKKMDCFHCKWFCTQMTEKGYAKCIDDITPQIIIQKINEIIGENSYGK